MTDTINKLAGKQLIEDEKYLTERASYYHRNKAQAEEVSAALSKIEIIRVNLCTDCIDISIAGDRFTLNAIFSAFRFLGYEPTERPSDKPESSFSCYWNHPDHEAKFWLSFTSTQCTRVKVGTETIERDVYETVCE